MGAKRDALRGLLRLVTVLFSYEDWWRLRKLLNKMYSNWIRFAFAECGENIHLQAPVYLKGAKWMKIGDYFGSLPRLRLECWDSFCGESFLPKLEIGTNVSFNAGVHIGCINEVRIGDDVLVGSNVCIVDHQHGFVDEKDYGIPPSGRPLTSRGPIVIGDGVWIGENAVILPNVELGHGSVVGANSVVTKSFPAYSVVAGNPAKLIRCIPPPSPS